MSVRTVIVAVLALVCGVSAAVAVNHLRTSDDGQPQAPQTVPIAIARVEIARGTTINAEMVGLRDWPKDLVPPGAITNIEEALNNTAMTSIIKDEPLLRGKIAEGRGLAPMIPPGMRAYTISASTASSNIAGFLMPGNKVDVLLTIQHGTGYGGGTTATLLQLVEVLAVAQLLDAPAENKVSRMRSVTLLVTPSQAAKLSLAQQKGTLHLTLRNDTDESTADTRPVTLTELRFLEEPPADYAVLVKEVTGQLSASLEKVAGAAFAFAQHNLDQAAAAEDDQEPSSAPAAPPVDLLIRASRGVAQSYIQIKRDGNSQAHPTFTQPRMAPDQPGSTE
jgi:pilus assembly protein CpaB